MRVGRELISGLPLRVLTSEGTRSIAPGSPFRCADAEEEGQLLASGRASLYIEPAPAPAPAEETPPGDGD